MKKVGTFSSKCKQRQVEYAGHLFTHMRSDVSMLATLKHVFKIKTCRNLLKNHEFFDFSFVDLFFPLFVSKNFSFSVLQYVDFVVFTEFLASIRVHDRMLTIKRSPLGSTYLSYFQHAQKAFSWACSVLYHSLYSLAC